MNSRHIQIGLLFIGVCLAVGLGLAFLTTKPATPVTNETAAITANEAEPADIEEAADKAPATAAGADFIITNTLLRGRPTWEDVGQGPEQTSFCEGDTVRVSNSTERLISLNQVPVESDASEGIGTVASGKIVQFDAGSVGTWNITDADEGGPLFQYVVTGCTKDRVPILEKGPEDTPEGVEENAA